MLRTHCLPSSASDLNSPPETCGLCIWHGCRATACGDAMRMPSAMRTRRRRRWSPPVPAGLGSLTAPQRALADFLRLDSGLLEVAAEGSPGVPEEKAEGHAMGT